ncbi:PREDICTED: uncharacterized protein LOC109209063 [Nicotiana attenuata]|uniref:uncharacterized protein LOC109209063 n=1 Tax=Nicotiana attenuata TaxID=49451 RepID=UPI000904E49A|nr:PREDICTED: uncharacterized protein LOC109209063 [Nicotiana attenuata]
MELPCALYGLGFKGSPYTWWNGRSDDACIFKRIDRYLANQQFQNLFPSLEVEHLIKYGSDHAPLLLSCNVNVVQVKKPFKYLNFWTKYEIFLDVVKENWKTNTMGSPFIIFQHKLKNMIKHWLFGVKLALEIFSRKRKRLQVSRILDNNGIWLEDKDDMAQEAMEFFKAKFTEDKAEPTLEEVMKVVFGLKGESASGPDGFTGQFYHVCWEVIGEDACNNLFCGAELPKRGWWYLVRGQRIGGLSIFLLAFVVNTLRSQKFWTCGLRVRVGRVPGLGHALPSRLRGFLRDHEE